MTLPDRRPSVAATLKDDRMDSSNLITSLIWSSVGIGCFVYGKKQKSFVPWLGGVALILITYFVDDAVVMSLIGAVILVAMYFGRHLGD